MDKIQILVVGRNIEIVPVLQRLIEKNEHWQCRTAYTDEDAILEFQQMHYDVVLLSSSIEEASELKLRNLFLFQQPEVIILQHYDGGSSLLESEILEALDKREKDNKARLNFYNGTFN